MDGTWDLYLPGICYDYQPYGAADYSELERKNHGHVISIRAVLVQWENGDFRVYDDTTYSLREMRDIARREEWKHRALYEEQSG